MYIKRFWRKINFHIDYIILKDRVCGQIGTNILAYPIYVDLVLNKKNICKKVMEGTPLIDYIQSQLDKKKRIFSRNIIKSNKKYSPEFIERYNKWCERQRNIQEVKMYFGEDAFDNIE